jgi:hypothetical protein
MGPGVPVMSRLCLFYFILNNFLSLKHGEETGTRQRRRTVLYCTFFFFFCANQSCALAQHIFREIPIRKKNKHTTQAFLSLYQG